MMPDVTSRGNRMLLMEYGDRWRRLRKKFLVVLHRSNPSGSSHVMNMEGSRRVTQSGVWIVFSSRCFFSASIYRPDRSRSMEVVSHVQKFEQVLGSEFTSN